MSGMFAMITMMIIAVWGLFGFLIWHYLIKRFIQSKILKICLAILLAIVWFAGPVFDEVLGARKFRQLCWKNPPIKFYGPVAVGPGAFFDEQGQPKWSNSDEFSKIKRGDGKSEYRVSSKTENRKLCEWPIPIVKRHTVFFDRETNKILLESFSLYSQGGWLRRFFGIGDYQCLSRGKFPDSEEFIIFKNK